MIYNLKVMIYRLWKTELFFLSFDLILKKRPVGKKRIIQNKTYQFSTISATSKVLSSIFI
jgi:hypothetical protein